jgi:hypothetical protein
MQMKQTVDLSVWMANHEDSRIEERGGRNEDDEG